MPAKNSEAIFWRPRFTKPLRAGKRANASFACSEGFFCARRAAPFARTSRSRAACRCCALLARLSRPFCCPVSFSAGAVCAGLLLPLFGLLGLLRRGQGGAAARQLCVRFPAGAPAFCGVVSRPACLIAAFALCLPCALCALLFSLVFHLFLPHFFLSKYFSLVAQAATGLYFLPKRK